MTIKKIKENIVNFDYLVSIYFKKSLNSKEILNFSFHKGLSLKFVFECPIKNKEMFLNELLENIKDPRVSEIFIDAIELKD